MLRVQAARGSGRGAELLQAGALQGAADLVEGQHLLLPQAPEGRVARQPDGHRGGDRPPGPRALGVRAARHGQRRQARCCAAQTRCVGDVLVWRAALVLCLRCRRGRARNGSSLSGVAGPAGGCTFSSRWRSPMVCGRRPRLPWRRGCRVRGGSVISANGRSTRCGCGTPARGAAAGAPMGMSRGRWTMVRGRAGAPRGPAPPGRSPAPPGRRPATGLGSRLRRRARPRTMSGARALGIR